MDVAYLRNQRPFLNYHIFNYIELFHIIKLLRLI